MTSSLHLAVAQVRPRKGDYAANVAQLRDIFAQLGGIEPRPQVLQFPETVMSGYFVEGAVREVAVTAGTLARDLSDAYTDAAGANAPPLDVVVGFYEKWRDTLHNSAMYVRLGDGAPKILHVHRKTFLPTYGLFDEERFVERGHDIQAFETPWGRGAMLVCEDAWHSLSGTIAAIGDAQVIFVVSAAPARGTNPRDDAIPGPSNGARWERLIRDIAEEHGVFCALSNLVGSEGGKMFAGASLISGPRGDVRVRGPVWEEAVVTATLDFADLSRARADTPLLADLRTALPHLKEAMSRAERGEPLLAEWDLAEGRGVASKSTDSMSAGSATEVSGSASKVAGFAGTTMAARGAPPPNQDPSATEGDRHQSPARRTISVIQADPTTQGAPPPLEIDAKMVETWLVTFLRDEMVRRGFDKVVVGISGGVDSAVTAFLAARALGPANVLGVRMPYCTSSPDSLAHAQLVVDALGIPCHTVDISAAVDGYLTTVPEASPGRRGNVMARVRMITLFDLSASIHGVPLGTGNKTERLFGYFTWHADDSPPINPLGDLFKTQVWALARHLGVPDVIVGKPASADLISGQTDEGDFGISYARADEILNWMLSGNTAADLIARGLDPADVELVRHRLERTHWKRRLPTVAMLSHSAIGESYLRPVDY